MDYELRRSARKTLSVEITKNGTVLVRAPFRISEERINSFLKNHQKWILNRIRRIREFPQPLCVSLDEANEMKRMTENLVRERLKVWCERGNFSYEGFRVTFARTRFGSCSSQNRLCSSFYLCRLSAECLDYVVLHELCHTVVHSHSREFYNLLDRFFENRKETERELREKIIPEIEKKIC